MWPQYIDNYASYGSFEFGMLLRAPEAPQKSQNFNFNLEKSVFLKSCIFA